MPDISFYHLTRAPLEQALPKLLEKAFAAQWRSLVLTRTEAMLESLNRALWTYHERSFLPHGSVQEGRLAEQPVLLTSNPADVTENPNQAGLLVCVEETEPLLDGAFERIMLMFDGADAAAVQHARGLWKQYRDAGHALAYWQQGESGGWQKKEG